MPHTVLEFFEAWQGKFARHRHIVVWRLMPHCLIWCIWRERNARRFEGCERSLLEIEGVFGSSIFITHISVSITYNSKMVGPMTKRLFGFQ